MTAKEFKKRVEGKAYDVDGAFGAQCWDLFAYFCQLMKYPIYNCTTTGYVPDLWNDRKKNGILKKFVETQNMQEGDWCIWGKCAAAPDGHIAMYLSDNGDGTGQFLGQNQGSNVANVITMPYAGSLGALRANDYVKKPAKKTPAQKAGIAASGTMVATVDRIRVRNNASLSKGETGLYYDKGMTLNYESVQEADGYFWLVYTSASTGTTRYIAYGTTDGKKKFWKKK